MTDLKFAEDYHTTFDPKTYLEFLYKTFKGDKPEQRIMQFFVTAHHEFWEKFESKQQEEIRYLEYGGGPCIANLVSACPKVDRVVFAEYTEANRQAVKSWIAGDPQAHDWTPLIEFILTDLEGNDGEISQAVTSRSEQVKQKIKSIVPCDAVQKPIVQLEPEDDGKLFDVIVTSLCLEAAVSTEKQYKDAVASLVKLVKPSGYLVMHGVLEETFYILGKEKFHTFPLSTEIVKTAMTDAGLEFKCLKTIPMNFSEASSCTGLFYAYGQKTA